MRGVYRTCLPGLTLQRSQDVTSGDHDRHGWFPTACTEWPSRSLPVARWTTGARPSRRAAVNHMRAHAGTVHELGRRRPPACSARSSRPRSCSACSVAGLMHARRSGATGARRHARASTSSTTCPSEFTAAAAGPAVAILDADGNVIATPYDENRIIVPLDKVAPVMQKAQIAIEDSRFYEHGGVDVRGLAARAGLQPAGRRHRRVARR